MSFPHKIGKMTHVTSSILCTMLPILVLGLMGSDNNKHAETSFFLCKYYRRTHKILFPANSIQNKNTYSYTWISNYKNGHVALNCLGLD